MGDFYEFFSIPLFQDEIKKGRIDVKLSENQALVHVVIFNALKKCRYNIQFFLGKDDKNGIKKGYIITDNFGNFNNTIRFNKENFGMNIENLNKTSLIVLIPEDDSKKKFRILGFRGEKYNFENIEKIQDLEPVFTNVLTKYVSEK